MKNRNFKELFLFFTAIVLMSLSFISIVSAQEVNYSTTTNYGGIQVSSLKYESYPANPGDYIDVWIKATIGSSVDYAKFEFVDSFPFSIDSSEDPIREYSNYKGEVVIHYKVRVDEDAVEGSNELKINIISSEYSDSGFVFSMEVDVAEAQTDFDLIIQDSTTSEISLAIANIGKNTANSMIVRIPEQDGYKITGTNGQMVGNLESGDYTIASFSVASVERDAGNLIVQIDYTDGIGERRSVLKEVTNSQSSSTVGNITDGTLPEGVSGKFVMGDFPSQKNSNTKWYIITGVLVLVLIGLFAYSKNTKKINGFFSNINKKNLRDNSAIPPEWVKKVKEKERK